MRKEDTTLLKERHYHGFCGIDWTAASNAHQYISMECACLLNGVGNITFWCVLSDPCESSCMEASKCLYDPGNDIGLGGEGMACDNQCAVSSNSRYLISQSAETS